MNQDLKERRMALNINGRMKVKTLRADFKKEFGLALRVYVGVNFADEEATLASIRKGDSKGGEFSPQRNTKVGNLEDKIMDMFGIKTQVAGSDDSYLCDNDKTLAGALEADEKLMLKRANRGEATESASTGDGITNEQIATALDTINNRIEQMKDEEEDWIFETLAEVEHDTRYECDIENDSTSISSLITDGQFDNNRKAEILKAWVQCVEDLTEIEIEIDLP